VKKRKTEVETDISNHQRMKGSGSQSVSSGQFKVTGNWGAWLAWGPCSKSCERGTRERKRNCDSTPPSNGGKQCPGPDTERDFKCNPQPCPKEPAVPAAPSVPSVPALPGTCQKCGISGSVQKRIFNGKDVPVSQNVPIINTKITVRP